MNAGPMLRSRIQRMTGLLQRKELKLPLDLLQQIKLRLTKLRAREADIAAVHDFWGSPATGRLCGLAYRRFPADNV